jgi:hypothetical protein
MKKTVYTALVSWDREAAVYLGGTKQELCTRLADFLTPERLYDADKEKEVRELLAADKLEEAVLLYFQYMEEMEQEWVEWSEEDVTFSKV